jgi:hypothetical protein
MIGTRVVISKNGMVNDCGCHDFLFEVVSCKVTQSTKDNYNCPVQIRKPYQIETIKILKSASRLIDFVGFCVRNGVCQCRD